MSLDIFKIQSHDIGNSVVDWIEQLKTAWDKVDGEEVSTWKSILSGAPYDFFDFQSK